MGMLMLDVVKYLRFDLGSSSNCKYQLLSAYEISEWWTSMTYAIKQQNSHKNLFCRPCSTIRTNDMCHPKCQKRYQHLPWLECWQQHTSRPDMSLPCLKSYILENRLSFLYWIGHHQIFLPDFVIQTVLQLLLLLPKHTKIDLTEWFQLEK